MCANQFLGLLNDYYVIGFRLYFNIMLPTKISLQTHCKKKQEESNIFPHSSTILENNKSLKLAGTFVPKRPCITLYGKLLCYLLMLL